MKKFLTSISLAIVLGLSVMNLMAQEAGTCGVCGGPVTVSSNLFEITVKDGMPAQYGCPGCGLSAYSALPADQQAGAELKAQDFLSRVMIDAKTAWYVRGSSVVFCCAPSWLAFATRENAEKFATGFGGEVIDFDAALKRATADHALHTGHTEHNMK